MPGDAAPQHGQARAGGEGRHRLVPDGLVHPAVQVTRSVGGWQQVPQRDQLRSTCPSRGPAAPASSCCRLPAMAGRSWLILAKRSWSTPPQMMAKRNAESSSRCRQVLPMAP